MPEKMSVPSGLVIALILAPALVIGQAFPVAVGPDTTFSMGAAYGITNGMVAVLGDSFSQYSVTGQLVYPPTTLIGDRISVGRQAVFPGPGVSYDGSNYLLVWVEYSGEVNGQLIDNSGNLVGSYFTIGTNAGFEHMAYGVIFGDTTYLVWYKKSDSLLYGRLVSKNGGLIGSEVQVSSNAARDVSAAFDGQNFLVAWVEIIPDRDKDVYGQFVSKDGALVGGNFLIDGGPYYSDNPTAMAFDGTRYLLGQHEGTIGATWLVGRFISQSGTVEQTIVLCDSTEAPHFPGVACDGQNYLVTWTQPSECRLMGRHWTPAGIPLDAPFVVFDSIDSKIPVGGVGFGGTYFLVVGSRIDTSFSDGDVYGRFYPMTGVHEYNSRTPTPTVSLANTPNPFRSHTEITFTIDMPSLVTLTIFDVAGRECAIVASEQLPAGTHVRHWDASALPNGVYFCRLQIGSRSQTKELVLLR